VGVVVGAPTATVSKPELSVSVTTLSTGQEIVGAGVLATVTVKLQVGPAPEETLTVVVPIGKVEPELGFAEIAPQSPSTLMAEAKFTTAPLGPVAVAMMFSGQLNEQAVPSAATTVVVSEVELLTVF